MRITNYTFNAAARTITLPDYAAIDIEGFDIIVNLSTNIVIYNFAGVGKGGTVSGNVLTLDYDTSAMSNSDPLYINYLDAENAPATIEEQLTQEDLLYTINEGIQRISRIANSMGIAADVRVTILGGTSTVTVSGSVTVGTVTTVSAVTNLSQIGSQSGTPLIPAVSNIAAIMNNLNNLAVT